LAIYNRKKNPAKFEECEKEIRRILEFLKKANNEACDNKEKSEIMDLKSPEIQNYVLNYNFYILCICIFHSFIHQYSIY